MGVILPLFCAGGVQFRFFCFLGAWRHVGLARSKRLGHRLSLDFTPERYETCPVSFLVLRFVRTCSHFSPPPSSCRPPRTVLPLVTRSTRLSTTRPTSSPRRASTTAPATSTTCSTAS